MSEPATEDGVRAAFRHQRDYCAAHDAPITGTVAGALAEALDRSTVVGRRVLDWPGQPIADALPLRLVGGLHALARRGDGELRCAFQLGIDGVDAIIAQALARHDTALLPWLDGPPQTNEPGRSAGLMAGLLAVAARYPLPFDLLEIGSSAGLNLLIDRYAYDLGGLRVGPEDAPVTIRPDWRGLPPPAAPIDFARVRGCDIAPVDVRGPAQAERLLAYVWADHAERFARVEAAIDMIRAKPVDLVAADAADWVEARLAEPPQPCTTRVLMHSIVWQYLGEARQSRIEAALARAGAAATAETPLAWVRIEADRRVTHHDLSVTTWPGGETRHLARTHAHGFWVEWLG